MLLPCLYYFHTADLIWVLLKLPPVSMSAYRRVPRARHRKAVCLAENGGGALGDVRNERAKDTAATHSELNAGRLVWGYRSGSWEESITCCGNESNLSSSSETSPVTTSTKPIPSHCASVLSSLFLLWMMLQPSTLCLPARRPPEVPTWYVHRTRCS